MPFQVWMSSSTSRSGRSTKFMLMGVFSLRSISSSRSFLRGLMTPPRSGLRRWAMAERSLSKSKGSLIAAGPGRSASLSVRRLNSSFSSLMPWYSLTFRWRRAM